MNRCALLCSRTGSGPEALCHAAAIGVRWRTAIPLADITAVTEIHTAPDAALSLALLAPTVRVTLRAPVEVVGLLGRRKRADRIALTIDDPRAFIAAVAAGRAWA